jgi:hypothetical protein
MCNVRTLMPLGNAGGRQNGLVFIDKPCKDFGNPKPLS